MNDKQDYRRLIEDLRTCASYKVPCKYCSRAIGDDCAPELKADAADAIETLINGIEAYRQQLERAQAYIESNYFRVGEPVNKREYKMPNGRTAVFEFDESGIGRCTVAAMDVFYEFTKQAASREWVSVEDRLPDERCIAGCFDKNAYEFGKMIIGYVDEICGDFEAWDDDASLEKATHWMPQPQPPEVEQNE